MPSIEEDIMKPNQETRINSQSMRTCSSKKRGQLDEPPSVIWAAGFNSLRISPPTNLQTAIDSIVANKEL